MSPLRRRLSPVLALALLVVAAVPAPGPLAPSHARAAEYELETVATYAVEPANGGIAVTVAIEFTNTTPDPAGQFSVFDQVMLAVHDEATDVQARDDEGDLDVTLETEGDVNVATVELREGLRFEETVELELAYTLPDTDDPRMRVRPSLVVFPAWSFGTTGTVRITIPSGYEVRVDGDPLTERDEAYESGEIADPSRWLALVTAIRAPEFTTYDATVPLSGGTADLRVRAFADDDVWGEAMRALLVQALPLLEAEIGLPYPLIGQLVVTEAIAADGSDFGEGAAGGTEILVAYDQPPFTALHQVSHVWLSPSFIEARWIREGMASAVAAAIAEPIEADPPFDPVEAAAERADAAFPLDAWRSDAGREGESYGYAASWAVIDRIEDQVGADAIRTVLRRVAAALGPYQAASIEPQPTVDGVTSPASPLTSRAFLDHLETVSGADLSGLFADMVLGADDVAMLETRAAARGAFFELADAGGNWGTPDPVRGAMTAWSFDDAERQIADARAWLVERDRLVSEMSAAGLSASDRLQEAYRAYGGGSAAISQLNAHRAVVEAYVVTADAVNAERTFVERIGLIGGPEPSRELAMANGRFASGDLRGAVEAISEAQRILAAAETSGIVRLVSAALVVLLVLGLAILLVRRRSSYTAAP
jgi:hypothetical protein